MPSSSSTSRRTAKDASHQKDVEVLEETGRRIRSTYGNNLLADASGASELLDNDNDTYISLEDGDNIIITLPEKRTINRIVLQEAIATVGERAEMGLAVDALLDGKWHEIAASTNIGHKRILRFNDIETDGLRFRLIGAGLRWQSAEFQHIRRKGTVQRTGHSGAPADAGI